MLTIKVLEILPENGHSLDNDDPLQNLETLADSDVAIILNFPAFTDGRAFSQARKIRRHGFTGELIASGDIRSDQARQYAQVGFSALHFTGKFDKDVVDKALSRFNVPYQNSSHQGEIVYEHRLHKEKQTILSGGGSFD